MALSGIALLPASDGARNQQYAVPCETRPAARRDAGPGGYNSRMQTSPDKRRGSLFVIAAPSGAGKTSLVKAVLERDPVAAGVDFPYHPQAARHRSAGA